MKINKELKTIPYSIIPRIDGHFDCEWQPLPFGGVHPADLLVHYYLEDDTYTIYSEQGGDIVGKEYHAKALEITKISVNSEHGADDVEWHIFKKYMPILAKQVEQHVQAAYEFHAGDGLF